MTERIKCTCKIVKKDETRLLNWKEKALTRGKRITALKKRLEEVRSGRDSWKQKYFQSQLLCSAYKKELSSYSKTHISRPAIRNHSYDLFTVRLCLSLKQAGRLSLRSCVAVLEVIVNTLGLEIPIPCINTIRNWENKQGYYHLDQPCRNNDDYAIIIDESYCIGSQTLLLILGVNLRTYKFDKSLSFEDVELLGLSVGASWGGDEISNEITEIQERCYELSYCCSDGGRNIKKALRLKDIDRVADCTHYFSKIIENEYKTKEHFKNFVSQCALLNRQNYMGADTAICPPKLKGKSRFLNLYTLAKWGKQSLNLLKSLSLSERTEKEQRIYDKLLWLKEYEDLVNTLKLLTKKLKAIFKILKANGLTEQTICKIENLVDDKQVPVFFKEGIKQYIQDNEKMVNTHKKLICCSDIIESHFGKFKNQQRNNPNKGLTINCLTIANYGKQMEPPEIKKAMEQVRIIDLEKWKIDNNLKTFVAKKKELYKNVG